MHPVTSASQFHCLKLTCHAPVRGITTLFPWWVSCSRSTGQTIVLSMSIMGAVRMTSLNPKFNGSHFATQVYQQNDWLGVNLPYTMAYAHRPHPGSFIKVVQWQVSPAWVKKSSYHEKKKKKKKTKKLSSFIDQYDLAPAWPQQWNFAPPQTRAKKKLAKHLLNRIEWHFVKDQQNLQSRENGGRTQYIMVSKI